MVGKEDIKALLSIKIHLSTSLLISQFAEGLFILIQINPGNKGQNKQTTQNKEHTSLGASTASQPFGLISISYDTI